MCTESLYERRIGEKRKHKTEHEQYEEGKRQPKCSILFSIHTKLSNSYPKFSILAYIFFLLLMYNSRTIMNYFFQWNLSKTHSCLQWETIFVWGFSTAVNCRRRRKLSHEHRRTLHANKTLTLNASILSHSFFYFLNLCSNYIHLFLSTLNALNDLQHLDSIVFVFLLLLFR